MQSITASRAIRSVRFRVCEMWGRLFVSVSGVTAGPGLKVVGAPVISLFPGSAIHLGNRVTLISKSFATALGVDHPVVLRTLAAGAAIEIGDGSGMSGGTICAAKRVSVGSETRIGANVTITDTDFHSLHPAHRRGHTHPTVRIAEVRIGSHVLIGTDSIILKGVSIGDNSVIGAGSVVTRAIPANSIAAGNPCRVLRALTQSELGGAPEARLEAVPA